MKRRVSILLAALMALLAFSGAAEGMPGEVGEFELAEPELYLEDDASEPQAIPDPTIRPAPLPTLAPGSVNYPADKVNFEGEIWQIMTSGWGLTDVQASGLMVSIYAESAFCPYNSQKYKGVDDRGRYTFRTHDSVGFGLCQWTDPGRKAALRDYAVSKGDANLVWDFDVQMGFMRSELDLEALKSTATLYEVTEWAVLWYERPNQRYANSWPGRRYMIARQIFEAHTGAEYAEPELEFSIAAADGTEITDGCEIAADATLTVSSNYYWRLVNESFGGWLGVQCARLYAPDAMETCVCGYACDGDKALRLSVGKFPAIGRARLRFEIYRGDGVARTVLVTCVRRPEFSPEKIAAAARGAGILLRFIGLAAGAL